MNPTFLARYWHPLEEGRIQCDLCPRHCRLHNEQRGLCFVRQNQNGQMVLTTWGRSSGFCIDPIEKKPLYHFYPGSRVLSFGTAGCNLFCKFCQNWNISKATSVDKLCDSATPDQLVAAAQRHHCRSVAYTYNDPVIFLEYAVDVARACRSAGIANVAVTAGYIEPAARAEFYADMDAANVDLKGFSEDFYQRYCAGKLQPVLDTLLWLRRETAVWLELTTLLIPGANDSDDELTAMCDWITENLGPDTPLHFSAFHPDWKMLDTPPTPPSTLTRARNLAISRGLQFVYTGNVRDRIGGTTLCPHCQKSLIERDWFAINRYTLTDTGNCPDCQTPIAGRFAHYQESYGNQRESVRVG